MSLLLLFNSANVNLNVSDTITFNEALALSLSISDTLNVIDGITLAQVLSDLATASEVLTLGPKVADTFTANDTILLTLVLTDTLTVIDAITGRTFNLIDQAQIAEFLLIDTGVLFRIKRPTTITLFKSGKKTITLD